MPKTQKQYCEIITKKGKRCKNVFYKLNKDSVCVCKFHFKQNQNQNQNDNQNEYECSICFDTVNVNYKLKCNHHFHKKCVEKFFSFRFHNKLSMNCPNCRYEYSIRDVYESDIFR